MDLTGRLETGDLHVNLAAGADVKPHPWRNLDLHPAGMAVERVDLAHLPWPLPDDAVRHLYCSHYIEHVPRAGPGNLLAFLGEVWRVTAPGALVEVVTPDPRNLPVFWADPTHQAPVHHTLFRYLDPCATHHQEHWTRRATPARFHVERADAVPAWRLGRHTAHSVVTRHGWFPQPLAWLGRPFDLYLRLRTVKPGWVCARGTGGPRPTGSCGRGCRPW